MYLSKLKKSLSSRFGFFLLLVFLFWLKTIAVYLIDFQLGVTGIYQYAVLLINPIATTVLFFGCALYIKRTTPAYLTLFLIYIANSALLLFNVIYYREFTDFMTINVIFGYSSVSEGLTTSSFALLKPQDIIIFIDIILIILGFATRFIKFDRHPIPTKHAAAITSFALFFLVFNITLGEIGRPQLLTRAFDRNYLVKYLGIDTFTLYDGLKTAKNNQVRNEATSSDLNSILKFTKKHYAKANSSMFGIAKGRNVIVIHLESFEQFLINFRLNGKEVTPFLNSIYNSKSTYSFSNFFNQVGQGKTSDAENMLETSTYGLSQGSLFSSLGTDNTFEGAPAILNQRAGYSSAVFHGNKGSFWNRSNVYKNLGYQNFFDASYFNTNANNLTEYGLKDKLLFHDSVKYLERLQQPFYAKFITVSNHFPYELDSQNTSFKAADTGDTSVDNYFVTAHYLDQAVKEFFDYLKKSGLYDNSMIIIYGDHYGISNSRNLKLASLLGKSSSTWTDNDNLQMQRVPFMIHLPGTQNGGVQTQYGGEIDVLPTLLHLLGISSKRYIQFGTDLFSSEHDQVVAFRNENFTTPKYSVVNGNIYDNSTGLQITHPSASLAAKIKKESAKVNTELTLSDTLNNKNLLRFYVPKGFTPVNPKNYNYKDDFGEISKIQKILGKKSTSLWSKNGNKTTISDYVSDAPELKTTDDNAKNVSSAVASTKNSSSISESSSSSGD
ncbi:LTA synthase family protein [Liquorilactobacillus mali]|uniref:Sulfatase family protein n=1 Tax=Liquorilactobacillus mali KCTC 3596 = DSM 20444 TaxID=1046596 RepID=J1F592_9LACO|nr:LTA synthase family protein [Liquorilactobacillus mali]EJF01451.1 sulfatase [Liquorilactobacillus mali KCTC 3596 = DSM 20444]KRN10090.1 sulfatase family protein [Liquorilactobacillus mali KCTC 3596 = DSM 20444]MDC7953865.1 LTA synthase family protein [Liquorilactobacillus mali]QFQ75210.1 LTA synthase family protein [Liquorilactobacillus mali]